MVSCIVGCLDALQSIPECTMESQETPECIIEPRGIMTCTKEQPNHSGVFQGIFPWLITLCQPVLSQRGRKWLVLSSMTPHNLWTARGKAEVQPRTDGQTMADKKKSIRQDHYMKMQVRIHCVSLHHDTLCIITPRYTVYHYTTIHCVSLHHDTLCIITPQKQQRLLTCKKSRRQAFHPLGPSCRIDTWSPFWIAGFGVWMVFVLCNQT